MPDDPLDDERPPAGGPFQRLSQAQQLSEDTAQKLLSMLEQSRPVQHIRGSQVLSAVLGTIGFALFLHGIEQVSEDIPIVENGWGAMAVGILLLFATGLLLQKFIRGE